MGEDVFTRKEGSGRLQGRTAILNENNQKHLIELIDDNPFLVLDQMSESLTSQFEGFQVPKTALYDFMKKKCRISVKRAYFYAEERNSLRKTRMGSALGSNRHGLHEKLCFYRRIRFQSKHEPIHSLD